MSHVAKAIRLAAEIHEDQVDKGGEPYILHCLAVMHGIDPGVGKLREHPYEYRSMLCAAVLHDAIEDFEGEPGEHSRLLQRIYDDFGDRTLSVVERLSKEEGVTYEQYIERVAGDWIARRIKIADLTHNMDPSRLPEGEISEVDFKRWDKYRRALVRLKRED